MKIIKEIESVMHFQKGDYIYRYILVDRFKHTQTAHHGFDKKLGMTEAEIFQNLKPRTLKRKYIYREGK
jgi:hypothetical protein